MRFLDTNIILRYFTQDDPAKAQACLTLFQRVQQGHEELRTTESVIAEVAYVLSSPRQQYRSSHADIVALLAPLLRLPGVKLPRKRVVLRALLLYQQYTHLDFEDALSVATMQREGIQEIISYDTDFDTVSGITRLEP